MDKEPDTNKRSERPPRIVLKFILQVCYDEINVLKCFRFFWIMFLKEMCIYCYIMKILFMVKKVWGAKAPTVLLNTVIARDTIFFKLS